jgi:hypothetical protein
VNPVRESGWRTKLAPVDRAAVQLTYGQRHSVWTFLMSLTCWKAPQMRCLIRAERLALTACRVDHRAARHDGLPRKSRLPALTAG